MMSRRGKWPPFKTDPPMAGLVTIDALTVGWLWIGIDWAGKPKPTGRQRTRALWRRRGRR